ncbi:NADP-dependent oxidoreductase [Pullulanibacillus sp. KACC 23026]|uniref:NADP-dependent oxidoreductase n=1 Tax=Pullulanibacillus sp. KACC 23026 TaxID=3028315 RepID=UPI0023B186CD|nr:NADP-dependent oxidoreductase [Pullulanibacillus sp. KACC 23026]WEG13430.1 NADP-dependent oxidoreductase [Pullulanibacillus sp. KACC 23026]
MKAMIIEKYGKVPLKLADMPIPPIGEKDVLVEIVAASINPVDFKIRDGKVKMLTKYHMPLIMGNDFSGVVKQVGKGVKKFKVGDELYGRASKGRIGTFAEYIAIDEEAVALKPKNLSFEEAASIPLVGLTSYQALHDVLQLSPGEKVLIQAGSGGIGTFAIQLAKAMGVYVATTTSKAGYELVKSLGADQIIDYKKEPFDEMLHNYDGVYDTIGGETLEKAFKIVKPGGQVVSISGLPNARFGMEYGSGFFKTNLFRLITRHLTKLEKQYNVTYTFLFMKPSGEQLEIITELIESGKIKPVIDRIYPFEEAQKALDYSEAGRAKGKVILKIK